MDNELLKIPDSALLKLSRKEVGQLKSEIDYLNHLIEERDEILKEKDKIIKDLNIKLKRKLDIILTDDEKLKIKSGELYEAHKAQIKQLNEKVKSISRDNEELLKTIIELRPKKHIINNQTKL